MADVKKVSTRKDKAAQTRARMLRGAYDVFCEHGFRAATMDEIAERAGVAVQTLYFTFHTKDELLQAVHDWTVLGDDPQPPAMQPWHRAAAAEPDARRSLELFVEGTVTIEARVAPMVPVFHAVSADPAGAVFREAQKLRREGFEDFIRSLTKKRRLQPGMTVRRATDLLFVLGGPESYRSFVLEAGWTPKQWSTWVSATLNHDLFGDD